MRTRLSPSHALALLLVACGQPPVASAPTITPAEPDTLDDLVAVPPADAADLQLTWTWYRNGRIVPSITGDTVSAASTSRGEDWRVDLVVSDGKDDSAPSSASVTIGNAPPVGTVAITPESRPSGADLLADTSYTDPDDDVVHFTFAWTKDGLATAYDGATLPGDATARGQQWQVTATPNDGTDDGEPVTAVATIDNGLPQIRGAMFSPDPVTVASDATVAAEIVDPDGDPIDVVYAWTKNGEPAGSVEALPRDTFTRGDTLTVTITASDPTGTAEPVTIGPAIVANAPPRAGSVRLTPNAAREATSLVCTATDIADADGDAWTVSYAWTVDGVIVPGASSTSLGGAWFGRDDVVACVVTAADATGLGPAVTSNTVTIRNSPPVLDGVAFGTITPGSGQPITVELGAAHDDDGNAITYTYEWFVEGQAASTATELDASLFTLGDEIRCVVTPHDDREAGDPVSSPTALVANAPPVVTAVTFAPAAPSADTGIRAVPTARDPNGDPFVYGFDWTVDGTHIAGVSGDTLSGDWLYRGAVVTVDVTGTDAEATGAPFRATVTVTGNAVPSVASVRISPDVIDETVTARCVPEGYDDPDGDAPTYHYAWTVDQVDLGVDSATLTGTRFDEGDVLGCMVIPDDGLDVGIAVGSAAVTVGNAKPTLTKATLSPTSPKEGSTLTVTWQGLADPDPGDAPSLFVEYRWYVNGVVVSGATTNKLTGASFDESDFVQVFVSPNDGTVAGTPVHSDGVTILNTAPTVSTVSFSPVTTSQPTVSDTITATPVVSDPDSGETYTYEYTWLVNGGVKKTGSDPTLAGTSFRKGDHVKVTITANDGEATGASFTSAEVVVKDAAPGAPGVRLTPRWSTAGVDDLTCAVAVAAADPDGDHPVYTITWKRNGVAYPGVGDVGPRTRVLANDQVPAADVDDGDTWTCSIVASDGQKSGPPATATARAADFDLHSVTSGLQFSCGIDPSGAARCWGADDVGQVTPPSGTFQRVAAGQQATCGITSAGTLSCWGSLGTPLSGTWKTVAVGFVHACATDANGTIACWGNGTGGVLTAPSGTGYTSLSIGGQHSCVVDASGTVKCWGGTPAYDENVSKPGFVQVAAGPQFTCGLKSTGALQCWGDPTLASPPAGTFVDVAAGAVHACAIDTADQLTCWGDGDVVDLTVPPGSYARVSPGAQHTCATRTDGTTICWGRGDEWQLQPPIADLVELGIGSQHGCGVDGDGVVTCWGLDTWGQADVPATLGPVERVTAGRSHTCAVDVDGVITCWGEYRSNQLHAPTSGTYVTLDAGLDHTCALDDAGLVACWGDDTWGQSTVPVALASTVFVDVSAGEHHTCAVADSGDVSCWGSGMAAGTEGIETVPPSTRFTDVAAGLYHTCGVLRDGTLDCWGDDFYHQSTPPGGSYYVDVVAGQTHSCALTSAGQVVCWGSNDDGMATPPTTGTFVAIEAGWNQTCALRDDGRTICWGKYGWN